MINVQVHWIGGLLASCVERICVVHSHGRHFDAVCGGVGVELSVTVGNFGAVVVEGVCTTDQLDVGEGEVTCDPAVECVLWCFLVLDFDALTRAANEAVADIAAGTVAEQEALAAASAHHSPTVYGRS